MSMDEVQWMYLCGNSDEQNDKVSLWSQEVTQAHVGKDLNFFRTETNEKKNKMIWA